MPAARLTAALVTYRTEPALLERALGSLARAIEAARLEGLLSDATVFVVDNDPPGTPPSPALAAFPATAGTLERIAGHGNVGYGRANNLALARATGDVHLVMNPDVVVDREALAHGLRALEERPARGLVTPRVEDPEGRLQYLCRRQPTAWALFLRGFAPAALRRRFERTLARYEMREETGEREAEGIPCASGCFMLARTALLKRLGGFDERFFMYFEDYDLSLRLGREASIAYVPAMRIVHAGGNTATKGLRHIAWFVASAGKFFSRHGWRLC